MEEKLAEKGENISCKVSDLEGILLTDISLDTQKVRSGKMSEICKLNDGRIHCLVIAAKMNQNETEAFERRKIV
jgi:diphthamide biosynthesis methyltransferase